MINLLLNIRVRKSKTSFIKTQNDYLFPSICNCWQCQLKSTSASHEKQTKLQEFANRYTANKTSRKQGSETVLKPQQPWYNENMLLASL